MKPKLENLTEKTQDIRLTSAEKFDMLSNLRSYANAHPAQSGYQAVWFRQAFAVYASAFILVVATGATSFAAEQALPGDALYSIKTNVNEGVVRTLPLPASAKAKVEVSMIDRRMGELEEMIVTNQDTPEKVDFLMDKIDDHKSEFDEHVDALAMNETGAQSEEIRAELETVVDAHIVVLEEITDTGAVEEVVVPANEPVVEDAAPESENTADMYASVPADDSVGADNDAADESMMMTMQARTAPLPVETDIAPPPPAFKTTKVRVVDPIVEEVTEFSLNEIKSFTADNDAVVSEEDQKDRESLRQRIFERAEKQFNIEIDFLDGNS